MDVTSQSTTSDITESGATKSQSDCISSQPTANGTLPHHSTGEINTEEAPPPLSDRSEDADSSDDSLIDTSCTNDVSRLLPTPPTSAQRKQKGVDASSASPPPICTPPSPSLPSPPPSRSSTCNRRSCSLHHHHHQHTNQKRLSSSKSHTSMKTDAAHIKEVAGDDCCIHCLLACLYCEMLSMCSALGECLACGIGGGCCDSTVCCCCCMEAAGDAACTEEACQAVLDCGIVEDCCGSSDCLEICLECCSICFPA
ncbi:myoD family inhibitor [Cheilinus undulatus]|uniref:myoD family inhibitor n=1 Tax=Cheilinus undulatus TaxID=241271 RepID=UPI001BD28A1E|nr:myoD family inhibitor [Cheilinus undulatus]